MEELGAFTPALGEDGRSSHDNVFLCTERTSAAGERTANAACRALGHHRHTWTSPSSNTVQTGAASIPLATFAHDDTVVCRCEGVTMGRIKGEIEAGADGPNRVKAVTRCGMGPCQGRICSNPLTRIISEMTGSHPDNVGAFRIRPPLTPILLGEYATLHEGPP
ncbi:MAG: (2Fe-2S)-binding protein [Pseudomonadota bacterium]